MVCQLRTSNHNIAISQNVIFYKLIFSKCGKFLRPLFNGICGLHKKIRSAGRQLINTALK